MKMLDICYNLVEEGFKMSKLSWPTVTHRCSNHVVISLGLIKFSTCLIEKVALWDKTVAHTVATWCGDKDPLTQPSETIVQIMGLYTVWCDLGHSG